AVDKGATHTCGGAALPHDHHVQCDLGHLRFEQQTGRDVVEGGGDPAVDEDLLGLLRGAALGYLQRERAAFVEPERVDAVHDDLPGQGLDQPLQQFAVAVPGHGDDDDVALGRGGRVVEAAHVDPGGFGLHELGGGLLGTFGVPGTQDDGVAGQGQTPGQAPALITGSAQDRDGRRGDVDL